ncbi:Transposase [Cordylochernes scorpioides]|uniref:Transposase n=1 Tax=Cordylochernes scorpioides TaxID=51811 RepID=A0ABY6KPW4_9ARAC|nr:Transposase [Cordylochernes scorpioides]
MDETWAHHFTPESKQQSMQWRHSGSPSPKKAKTVPSVGKVIIIMNAVGQRTDFGKGGENGSTAGSRSTAASRPAASLNKPKGQSGEVKLEETITETTTAAFEEEEEVSQNKIKMSKMRRRCWQKWVNNGRLQRQDGSGRSRATTKREDIAIVRMAVAAPESTLSTIQRVTGTQVSKVTINGRLKEWNLRARRPCVTLPTLTPVHRQVRLQWCRERSTWNCADWGRIVFSDESRFLLCPDDRRKHVWRRPGQRVDPSLTVEHHTGPQQGGMVWGAISFESRNPLVVIPGTLTTQRYVDDILRPVLLPFL